MLFVALLSFIALVFVFPLLRLWRTHRVFGLVLNRQQPIDRLLGLSLFATMGLLALWSLGFERFALWRSPDWMHGAGWALIASGLVLMIVAQAQMGGSWRIGIDRQPTELVTSGLYRVVRNPIYSALGLVLVGVVAVTPHPLPLSLAALAVAAVSLQARREERHLLALHGERYRIYANGVGRFVPGVGRL
jgi:protein-S-isoprenylcysteine O-methyltransferase Ste14